MGVSADVRDSSPVSDQADRKQTGSVQSQACTHAREIVMVAERSRRDEVPGCEGEGVIGRW